MNDQDQYVLDEDIQLHDQAQLGLTGHSRVTTSDGPSGVPSFLPGIDTHGFPLPTVKVVRGFSVANPKLPAGDTPAQQVDAILASQLAEFRQEREEHRIFHAKVAAIEGYGDEPAGDSPVIRFSKTYREGGTVYAYAAIKAGDGLWYLTGGNGKSQGGRDWDELKLWLASGEFPVKGIERLAPAADVELIEEPAVALVKPVKPVRKRAPRTTAIPASPRKRAPRKAATAG